MVIICDSAFVNVRIKPKSERDNSGCQPVSADELGAHRARRIWLGKLVGPCCGDLRAEPLVGREELDYWWRVKMVRLLGALSVLVLCFGLSRFCLPRAENSDLGQNEPSRSPGASAALKSGSWSSANPRRPVARQLEPGVNERVSLGWSRDIDAALLPDQIEIPGRRVPQLASQEIWLAPGLRQRAVALPEANTLAHRNYRTGRLAWREAANQKRSCFNPEMLLVKFRDTPLVSVVHVEPGVELEAARTISTRDDVEFAELDQLQRRCFQPNDTLVSNQWHHAKIGSFAAWDFGIGVSPVRVAIVDGPFQMDHPDLVARTVAGWDAVANQPITASPGINHSTLAAGLIAATLDNGVGVAGLANCQILPINTMGFESELCNAVYWAASNGVRVVNISWTGAGSDALNAAGNFLKTYAQGVLVMSGENGTGDMGLPNQPDIWVVAMTDEADNQRSRFGAAADFAAPGWAIYSTLAGNSYGFATGTSYAAPVVAGVVARLLTINPALTPDDVRDILVNTARDLGDPGWDLWFGWGRVDFGAAAGAAQARLPRLSILSCTNNLITIATGVPANLRCQLWRSTETSGLAWTLAADAQYGTNGDQWIVTASAASNQGAFFRVSLGQ